MVNISQLLANLCASNAQLLTCARQMLPLCTHRPSARKDLCVQQVPPMRSLARLEPTATQKALQQVSARRAILVHFVPELA